MRLIRLVAQRFRNLEPFDLATDAQFVVVHGPNAQGKTNLLEAVWTLATLRPIRGHKTRELIRWSDEEASVVGWVRGEDGRNQLRVDLGGVRRRASLDGQPVRDLPEYFACIRAIAFTPSDATIVTDAPVFRRAWLDRAAFTARPTHLARVRDYERTLAQKAALLRDGRLDTGVLDVLDDQLARAGAALVEARVTLLRELVPHVRAQHAALAGGGEVGVRYRTDADGDDVPARAARLREKLAAARADEVRRRRSLVGPHGDDVRLLLDGHPARQFGSRGQVRTLVLAMKLAELVAARARGDSPMFLLDDLSSELDRDRTRRLVQTLGELDVQVWISTTDPDHLGALPAADTLRILMRAGAPEPVRNDTIAAGPDTPSGIVEPGSGDRFEQG